MKRMIKDSDATGNDNNDSDTGTDVGNQFGGRASTKKKTWRLGYDLICWLYKLLLSLTYFATRLHHKATIDHYLSIYFVTALCLFNLHSVHTQG